MVVNHGVQITLYSFYKFDEKLVQYEDLFNHHKSAIIPMAYVINYLGKTKTEIENKRLRMSSFA
jgi:hypothetical protein